MTERATPFYCPFCGEEDIRPEEGEESSPPRWLCFSCRRVFAVTFAGLRLGEGPR